MNRVARWRIASPEFPADLFSSQAMTPFRVIALFLVGWSVFAFGATDGNRLSYLDSDDPFYVGRDFPRLITPQWVGEEGVDISAGAPLIAGCSGDSQPHHQGGHGQREEADRKGERVVVST